MLTWTTSEEYNNSHFEVQRSSNGNAFTKIGSVNGKGRQENTYNFTDEGPVTKINYYRLRQVDIDGKSSYSKVLVLRNDLGKITGKISPNPFSNFINVTYWLSKEEKIRIRLFDPSGKAVMTYSTRGNSGLNTVNLNDLQNIPKGIYTIELSGENVTFRQQALKQ